MATPPFPIGSVGHTLRQLHGTWHDHIELFAPDGAPLPDDTAAGSPGAAPFDNLVYFDFDGERLALTNVHWRGRPVAAKTFYATLRNGVLVFDPLGPGGYRNIGIAAGPGTLWLCADAMGPAWNRYAEPDLLQLTGPGQRRRSTVLYRDGRVVRTLRAEGTRLSPLCDRRHPLDPRGIEGPVHGEQAVSTVWAC